jgi:hypothetical protein
MPNNSFPPAFPSPADPAGVDEGGTGATTAAEARANLEAAKSGANSDITSITGLTTPLSSPQGGLGVGRPLAESVLPPYRHWNIWQSGIGTASPIAIGASNATPTGTLSSNASSFGHAINAASAASTDAVAGWAALGGVRGQFGPCYMAVFQTVAAGDLLNVRYNMGMFTSSPVAVDVPTTHYAAFRYATGTDGTAFWRCVSDNNSGTPQTTTTTIAVAAATKYYFIIDTPDNGVTYNFYASINDAVPTLVASHSTKVPSTTSAMPVYMCLSTTENVSKNIRLMRAAVSTK